MKKIPVFVLLMGFLILATGEVFSQAKTNPADKKAIARYINKLTREYQKEFDSTGSYSQGWVNYAPDGKFKLFSFQGDDCPGHCSSIYQNIVLFSNTQKPITLDSDIPVNQIFKMIDGKYLLLRKAYGLGAAVSTYEYQGCLLISIKNNKITYYPVSYNDPITGVTVSDIGSGSLTFYQHYPLDDTTGYRPIILKYDPKSKQLSYRYRYDVDNENKSYIFSGYFEYMHGEFILQNERKVPVVNAN